ncbi:MAG: hypothetical protein Q7R33_00755 [Nitrosarchaeum sp.]|nr:hypothetical protein [Nitrosarchaeum sp.]
MKKKNLTSTKQQKFVIKPSGEVVVEWIDPVFSDVILELYPKKEREQFLELNKEAGTLPHIFCG